MMSTAHYLRQEMVALAEYKLELNKRTQLMSARFVFKIMMVISLLATVALAVSPKIEWSPFPMVMLLLLGWFYYENLGSDKLKKSTVELGRKHDIYLQRVETTNHSSTQLFTGDQPYDG